jgi:hypothetical protein
LIDEWKEWPGEPGRDTEELDSRTCYAGVGESYPKGEKNQMKSKKDKKHRRRQMMDVLCRVPESTEWLGSERAETEPCRHTAAKI